MVIVGAGPAGLSAALEATQLGVNVLLIDENSVPGGQYYRHVASPSGVLDRSLPKYSQSKGREMIQTIQKDSRITFWGDATVWNLSSDLLLSVYRSGKVENVKTQKLILATGAYDRVVPFPGWTLPGIVTAGGAQVLIKQQGVVPGKRILVAGTGPLLLALADQLSAAGSEVITVAEATHITRSWYQLPKIWGHWSILLEGLGYWHRIRRAKIPVLSSHIISRVEGDREVEAGVLVQVDRYGNPVAGTDRIFQVDTVVVGFGFIPSIELVSLCGCRLEYDRTQSYWMPWFDENQQTSIEGVFVAGDGAGVAGAAVAEQEGRLAGLNAAVQLGRVKANQYDNERMAILGRLKKLHHLRAFLDVDYPFLPGFYSIITDDTIICRCEEISLKEITEQLKSNLPEIFNVNELKARIRTGMGLCQGRFCGPVIRQLIAKSGIKEIEDVGHFKIRPPIKPISVQALCGERN